MKLPLIFLCLFALTAAVPIPDGNLKISSSSISLNQELVPILLKDSSRKLLGMVLKDNGSRLIAVVNTYADRLFANFSNFIIENGLDPQKLEDYKGPGILTVETVTLANGWLQGLSSVQRGGDVTITYDPDDLEENVLNLVVPVKLDVMSASYDYCVRMLLIGPCGGVKAKITDILLEFSITFDFNTYQANLDYFHILHSGHIGLNFSGNFLFDWLWNFMINMTTGVLHQQILSVIESDIEGPIRDVVDVVNEAINSYLVPPLTTTVAPKTTRAPTTQSTTTPAQSLKNYLVQ